MSQIAVRAAGLTREFQTVRAVNDLTLEIPAGTVFGFLGPNGAGKTTTIRLLLGLIEPTRGSAHVLGFDVASHAQQIRERTGALLEHHGLYERLSATDNLEFYGRAAQMKRADLLARMKELLSGFELWDRRDESVGTWSRGMKQKLAIARALLHRPELVFLDEPTAGLDPIASAALREDLASLGAREGVTVFLTTHNLAEAERLCGMVGVIANGSLLASGHPDQLRAGRSDHVEVIGSGFSDRIIERLRSRAEVASVTTNNGRLILELHQAGAIAPLVSMIVRSGAAVEEIRKQTASLEDVFLGLLSEEATPS